MAGENQPGKLLRGGEFYSRVQSTMHTDDVLLSELRQPCARKVPRHEHELAYFTIMLSGDYLEGDHGRLEELGAFTAAFNPAGATHSTIFGPAGALFFTIELRNRHLGELGLRLPEHPQFDRGTGSIVWPGLRLFSAFRSKTIDFFVLECCVMEMLAAITGGPRERVEPRWMCRVKERLHDEFREPVRIGELAEDAEVHPVHLARAFRAIERQSPTEYLQRLRIRAACQLLRQPEWPLALIAAECGFSDQSHFTRVFQRIAGSTPAKFRAMLQA